MPRGRADEDALTADIVALASQYGRYGYRRIAAMLRDAGWVVNTKRVERIWRREGLKVPQKQPKKSRLWLNDGSCIRLQPERPNHVWSYDFVESRTHDGRMFRMLNVIDEFTRECLAIRIDRKLNSTAVIDVLTDLFILRGVPGHVRSDNGPEFIAKAVRDWIIAVGAKTAFIEPVGRAIDPPDRLLILPTPWENGYCESFNSKLRPSRQIALQSPAGQRTSCLMARYSTPWPRLAWSSRHGASTTILRGLIRRWAIDRPRREPSTGRHATADRPHLKLRHWHRDPSCTKIETGPLDRGRPLDMPAYHTRPSSPTNLTLNEAIAINEPIGCGDAPVFPNDVIVGDDDNVIVIPHEIVEEVAAETVEMTAYEDFVMERVRAGETIIGLYPQTKEAHATAFAEWRAAQGR